MTAPGAAIGDRAPSNRRVPLVDERLYPPGDPFGLGQAMHLYLIRHAQSANNALADQRERQHDPPLTDTGMLQAGILAQHLVRGDRRDSPWVRSLSGAPVAGEGFGITRLICSPMRRALQTAQPIGLALGLAPEIWADVHEYGGIYLEAPDGGLAVGYPGMTRAEIAGGFPDYRIPDEIDEYGWWHGRRESADECAVRAARVADRLRSMSGDPATLALVSHGDFTNFLLWDLLGLPKDTVRFSLRNTSITSLAFGPDRRIVISYANRTEHLLNGTLT